MDDEIREALNKLLEHGKGMDSDDNEIDVVSAGVKSRNAGNNPCGNEGQDPCPPRCVQDDIGIDHVHHCHVNNCNGDARCNKVVDINC